MQSDNMLGGEGERQRERFQVNRVSIHAFSFLHKHVYVQGMVKYGYVSLCLAYREIMEEGVDGRNVRKNGEERGEDSGKEKVETWRDWTRERERKRDRMR